MLIFIIILSVKIFNDKYFFNSKIFYIYFNNSGKIFILIFLSFNISAFIIDGD